MNFQDVRYIFPEAAYLVVVVFLFAWLFWNLYFYRQRRLNEFAPEVTRDEIFVPRRSRTLFASKSIALCFVWILAAIALMQPISYGQYPSEIASQPAPEKNISGKRKRKAHEVILLIDASSSMTVPDARNGKTRFAIAKDIADDIVSRLKGETVAAHAFTSAVNQLSPLTIDYLFVRLMLRQLGINEGGIAGTDLIGAMKEMQDLYFAKPSVVLKTIIVLTDGGDTKIDSLQGTEKSKAIQELLNPLRESAKNHLRIYTIGIGSKTPSAIPNVTFEGKQVLSGLNEGLLQLIAKTGRGEFFFANNYTTLDIAAEVVKELEKTTVETEEESVSINIPTGTTGDNLIHKHYYHLPLGIAILLLGITLVLQNTWSRRMARSSG